MQSKQEAKQQNIEKWNTFCNLRTNLLHLQFMYAQLQTKIEQQNDNLHYHHKDRLIQIYHLHQEHKQYSQSNWKMLLIAKLESLLAIYQPIDSQIWERLNSFMGYVQYTQNQLNRDLGRVYLGHKTKIDLNKCEKELGQIEKKIVSFLKENKESILLYNQRLIEIDQLKQYAKKYIQQVKQLKHQSIDKNYGEYIKEKLRNNVTKTQSNIRKLKSAILD